mmetsp:Transcript_38581/g.114646  ORF Transcript_38581/g.114646 Transcript_38581/m.114646 type:complete len:275 (+) Transcript_38581:2760-3584(+)
MQPRAAPRRLRMRASQPRPRPRGRGATWCGLRKRLPRRRRRRLRRSRHRVRPSARLTRRPRSSRCFKRRLTRWRRRRTRWPRMPPWRGRSATCTPLRRAEPRRQARRCGQRVPERRAVWRTSRQQSARSRARLPLSRLGSMASVRSSRWQASWRASRRRSGAWRKRNSSCCGRAWLTRRRSGPGPRQSGWPRRPSLLRSAHGPPRGSHASRKLQLCLSNSDRRGSGRHQRRREARQPRCAVQFRHSQVQENGRRPAAWRSGLEVMSFLGPGRLR